ncbi:MAG TPA: hypothetical protein DEP84_37100 [Chloroflexi bacterium]|nr:hypothetical protein [Chloroflexota bacterium]
MDALLIPSALLASLIGVAKQWTAEELQARFGLASILAGTVKRFWVPLAVAAWAAVGPKPRSTTGRDRGQVRHFDSGCLALLAWSLVSDILLLGAWNRIDTVLIFEALLQSVSALALATPFMLVGAWRGRSFVKPFPVAVALSACVCVFCCYAAVLWLIYPFLRA